MGPPHDPSRPFEPNKLEQLQRSDQQEHNEAELPSLLLDFGLALKADLLGATGAVCSTPAPA